MFIHLSFISPKGIKKCLFFFTYPRIRAGGQGVSPLLVRLIATLGRVVITHLPTVALRITIPDVPAIGTLFPDFPFDFNLRHFLLAVFYLSIFHWKSISIFRMLAALLFVGRKQFPHSNPL